MLNNHVVHIIGQIITSYASAKADLYMSHKIEW